MAGWPAIKAGNKAAHSGDGMADATLFDHDHCTDRSLHRELYGLDYQQVRELCAYMCTVSIHTRRELRNSTELKSNDTNNQWAEDSKISTEAAIEEWKIRPGLLLSISKEKVS